MPRNSFPVALKTALANGTVRPGVAVGIERTDGVRFGFVRHDAPVTLPDFSYDGIEIEELNYVPDASAVPSNIRQTADLQSADNLEISVTLGDYVSESDCNKKLFSGASWWLLVFDRDDVTQQGLMLRGKVGEVRVEGQKATFKLRSLADRLNQEIIELTSPRSRWTWQEIETLGYFDTDDDSDDGYPVKVTTTVTSVSNTRRKFIVSALAGQPAARFQEGTIEWTSGNNDGYVAEIMDFDETNGELTLWEKTPEIISAGDGVIVLAKVPETRNEWTAIIGDMRYFGGCPEIITLESAGQVVQL